MKIGGETGFVLIERSEFETGVAKGIATRKRLKDELKHLNGKNHRVRKPEM